MSFSGIPHACGKQFINLHKECIFILWASWNQKGRGDDNSCSPIFTGCIVVLKYKCIGVIILEKINIKVFYASINAVC
jgi:hypothetical protein